MTFEFEFDGRRPDPQWRATAALTLVARGMVQLRDDNQWALAERFSLVRGLVRWCDPIQDELDAAFDSQLIALPADQLGVAAVESRRHHWETNHVGNPT